MEFDVLDGWWTDAGTFESLLRASNLVAQKVNDGEDLNLSSLAGSVTQDGGTAG